MTLLSQGEEYCVSSLAKQLGVSVSAVSEHFRFFELAGLVDKHRYGQMIVAGSKLYHIVSLPKYGDTTVTLTVPTEVSLYTFTFGS